MNVNLKTIIQKILSAVQSQRGQNLLVFCVFFVISTVLWFVMALNDEMQCDIRMPLEITHVPDSVTLISTPPSNIAVSLRARGSQRLKLSWGDAPAAKVDFRIYRSGKYIKLSSADIKSAARENLGGASVSFVSPDSLSLAYTTGTGVLRAVSVDSKVTADAQSAIVGEPEPMLDSVRVFSINNVGRNVRISTEPIRVSDISGQTTVRARLIPPTGARVVPDSIDVTFNVEPLIRKTRKVIVETLNVPSGLKLITFPAQIEVAYMMALSDYKTSEPRMRVVADYRTLDLSKKPKKIRLKLSDVSSNLQTVQLATDSVEFIIEHL